jgi:hypothetical protein
MKGLAQVILFAGCLSAQSAWAVSGAKLIETGNQFEQTQSGFFLGYVAGIADSFRGSGLCLPSDATYGQLAAITLKYLRNNPEEWNKDGSGLVYESLSAVFPCKKT